MGDLTKDFSVLEVRCKCVQCQQEQSPALPKMSAMLALQSIRDDFGGPLTLVCAIRCVSHNEAEGGAPDSRHLPIYGDAFDIACTDSNIRFRLVGAAIRNGARFIEICPNHIHVDFRPSICRMILGEDHA